MSWPLIYLLTIPALYNSLAKRLLSRRLLLNLAGALLIKDALLGVFVIAFRGDHEVSVISVPANIT